MRNRKRSSPFFVDGVEVGVVAFAIAGLDTAEIGGEESDDGEILHDENC